MAVDANGTNVAGTEGTQTEASVGPSDADVLAALESGKPGEAGAAPGAATPTTADPAKPADPKPETPKESALLRSLQKRERDLVAEKQALQARIAQAEAGIEQRIKDGIARALKEQFADPRAGVKALGALGMKDQDIADALLHKDAATPDEMARKAIAETEALRKQLADGEAARVRAQNEANYTATAKRMADAGELKHVFDEWDQAEILSETYKLLADLNAECRQANRPLPAVSDERLLKALDKRAKAKQDSRAERQKAKTGATDTTKAAGQPDPKAADTNGSGHQGGKTGASATTTLGKGLGERQTVTVPDPLLMSDEDIIANVNKKVSEGFTVRPR